MQVLGWITIALGCVMLVAVLTQDLRANTGSKVPLFIGKSAHRKGAVALRSLGAGTLTLGTILVGMQHGPWVALVAPILLLILTTTLIVRHNRHLNTA